MRRILLISDTHSYLDPTLTKHMQEADEVWHAGDIGHMDVCTQIQSHSELKAVHGNIDDASARSQWPEDLCFMCEDVKVLITHIGGYPNKYPARIKTLLQQHKPQLFICGHSHILKVMYDKNNQLLHMNPGAAGNQGFHHMKTALRFTIDKKDIKHLDIIEIGLRHATT